jgi:hypothetical protein
MGQITQIYVIEMSEAIELAEEINKFNKSHNCFATQIYPTPKGWTAFCYYREYYEEEIKNEKL